MVWLHGPGNRLAKIRDKVTERLKDNGQLSQYHHSDFDNGDSRHSSHSPPPTVQISSSATGSSLPCK